MGTKQTDINFAQIDEQQSTFFNNLNHYKTTNHANKKERDPKREKRIQVKYKITCRHSKYPRVSVAH